MIIQIEGEKKTLSMYQYCIVLDVYQIDTYNNI